LKVGVLGQVHALHLVVDVPHVVVHCIDGVVICVLHVVIEEVDVLHVGNVVWVVEVHHVFISLHLVHVVEGGVVL